VAISIAIAIGVGAVLLLQNMVPNTTRDARNAMRDARADMTRSFPLARSGSKHVAALLRGESFQANRRGALADLDRVIRLRKRALARLGDVPSGAHSSYQRVRARWETMLRSSIRDARSVRSVVSPLRPRDLRSGVVVVEPGTGFLMTGETMAIPLRLTAFVAADVTLRQFDRALRRANSWIR
jgi:hypothetical protein